MIDAAIPIEGGTMRAALALPPVGDGPWPAVIVIHEIFGLNDDIRGIAQRFADNGYAALAVDLYSRGPKLLCIAKTMRQLNSGQGVAFADLEAAREWLVGRPEVDGSRVGVTGFCMGGGFALLFAMNAPIGVAAPFYGAVPKTTEELRGSPPVVGSYGGRDRMFVAHAKRLESSLTELGIPHDVKMYPDAGHSFMSRHGGGLLAKVVAVGPMKVGYNRDASEDAWSRVLAFFGEHLRA